MRQYVLIFTYDEVKKHAFVETETQHFSFLSLHSIQKYGDLELRGRKADIIMIPNDIPADLYEKIQSYAIIIFRRSPNGKIVRY